MTIDNRLSNRFIELDEGEYFLIHLDRVAGEIQAEHYINTIDSQEIACDPETGEPGNLCGPNQHSTAVRNMFRISDLAIS